MRIEDESQCLRISFCSSSSCPEYEEDDRQDVTRKPDALHTRIETRVKKKDRMSHPDAKTQERQQLMTRFRVARRVSIPQSFICSVVVSSFLLMASFECRVQKGEKRMDVCFKSIRGSGVVHLVSLFAEHLISNGDGDKEEKRKKKELYIRHHKYANGEDLEGRDRQRDRRKSSRVSVGKTTSG